MTRRSRVGQAWAREPVALLAVVEASLAVAVAFGLHLTGRQLAALIVLARAVFALLARRLVTPVAEPRLPHRKPGRRRPPRPPGTPPYRVIRRGW